MKKFLILSIFALVGLMGCRKYTTPTNVRKALSVGTWKVARLIDNKKNVTDNYIGVNLAFGGTDQLKVGTPDTNFVGTWEIPTNAKTPAHLFINLPETYLRTLALSDDWIVIYRTDEEVHLERLNGKYSIEDECILRKI